MAEKSYKQKIKEYVEDGFVAFEHGYKPKFNMWGVSSELVYGHYGVRFKIDELTESQAQTIYRDIKDYEYYCKTKA
jgi:hypothetical protein